MCHLLAAHAEIPIIEPRTPEQVLEIIGSLLVGAGSRLVTPSMATPLEPYLRKHRKLFERDLVRLGAGRVPVPTIQYPAYIIVLGRLASLMFIATCLLGITSAVLGSAEFLSNDLSGKLFVSCVGAGAVSLASILLLCGLSYWRGQAKPRLGSLETFGDLVQTLLCQ